MRKLLLASILVSSPAFAEAPTYTVLGIGKLTCGKYLDEVSRDPLSAESYSWWVSGFVTAANVDKSRSIPTDAPAHDAWLKLYCEKNPLDSFVQAASALNTELEKRAVK
jgi:hypothetical protein